MKSQHYEQTQKQMADMLPKAVWPTHLDGGYTEDRKKAFAEYYTAAKDATEEAYRRFFADKGIQAVMVPTIPDEPHSMADWTSEAEPSPMSAFKLASYTISFNSCSVPSLSVPTPIISTDSAIPMSVLLWGVDDRELLSVGAALEKAMKS